VARGTAGTRLLLQKKATAQRTTAIKRDTGITIANANLHPIKAGVCVESTSLLLGGEQKETPLESTARGAHGTVSYTYNTYTRRAETADMQVKRRAIGVKPWRTMVCSAAVSRRRPRLIGLGLKCVQLLALAVNG